MPSLSYFDFTLTLCHKIKSQTKSNFYANRISQSRQFKNSIVYVVKVAISYNCFPTIMQHFCSQKCFYFKTPGCADSIWSPSYSFSEFFYNIKNKILLYFLTWTIPGLRLLKVRPFKGIPPLVLVLVLVGYRIQLTCS